MNQQTITRAGLQSKSNSIKKLLDEMTQSKIVDTETTDLFLRREKLVTLAELKLLEKKKRGNLIELQESVLIKFNHSFDGNAHLTCNMLKGSVLDQHLHDFYEYFYLTKGHLTETIEGKRMTTGIIYCFKPGQLHGFKADEDTVMLVIGSKKPFTPDFYKEEKHA